MATPDTTIEIKLPHKIASLPEDMRQAYIDGLEGRVQRDLEVQFNHAESIFDADDMRCEAERMKRDLAGVHAIFMAIHKLSSDAHYHKEDITGLAHTGQKAVLTLHSELGEVATAAASSLRGAQS
jgi:hypothetical protein